MASLRGLSISTSRFNREHHLMKPVIALVGRPNVGKSTLFNRLTRSRDALVADLPGLTRDRHYGEGRVGDRPYLVVDTGGFEPVAKDGILHEMARQTRQAVEESDVVVFIIDGRNGLAPQDKSIADYLRKTGRPMFLVVNKAEGMKYSAVAADFYELGLGDPRAISAAHGDGVTEMISEALGIAYAGQPEEDDEEKAARGVKIAIVGRPNVGKSTLINALVGEERVIAFDMPGTTRDSIYVDFERRAAVHADRHRRLAPSRQGIRSDRKVLGREDASVDLGRERGDPAARRAARISPSRTRTSPASWWSRAVRWWSA